MVARRRWAHLRFGRGRRSGAVWGQIVADRCGARGSRNRARPCMMRRMTGRLLAMCGWLAWQFARPFRATPLRRLGMMPAIAVAGLLLLLAAPPLVTPQPHPQPPHA